MAGPISISRIEPAAGRPGSLVSISGSNFSDRLDENKVEIGGVPALVVRVAKTELQVLVDETCTGGPIIVTSHGSIATAPSPFKMLPAPDSTKPSESGPPITVHGPQHGTPTVGIEDQKVLVLFTHGKDEPPADPDAERDAEISSLDRANRYWSEATYAFDRTSGATTFQFTVESWINLPKAGSEYIWSMEDIISRRRAYLTGTKRWAEVVDGKAAYAHLGGGIAVTDLAGPPTTTHSLPSTWIARHIAVHGHTAFVVVGSSVGIVSVDISAAPREILRVPTGNDATCCTVNEAGNLLAVGGMEDSIEIYDVQDPAAIVLLTTITLSYPLTSRGMWVTSVKLLGTTLVAGVGTELILWDLTTPTSPSSVASLEIDNVSWITGVDAVGSTCVVSTAGAGISVVDISSVSSLRVTGWARRLLQVFSIQLSGNTATAACGPDGVLILDVSDPANVVEMAAVSNGQDCFHVTGLFDHDGTTKCMASFGALVIAVTSLDSAGARLGPLRLLPHSLPRRPVDPDLGKLRDELDVAVTWKGQLKDDHALHIDALGAANKVESLDADFVGVIIYIWISLGPSGPSGRATSFTADYIWSSTQSLKFDTTKGFIWLPGGRNDDGVVAHELVTGSACWIFILSGRVTAPWRGVQPSSGISEACITVVPYSGATTHK
jgi:hypothetical protein